MLDSTSPSGTSAKGDNTVSDVQVNKIQPEGENVLLLTQQVDALYEEICRRAFRQFESRGGVHGHDKEDWIEAERSLIFAPPAELVEEEDQFSIRMSVPGFEAGQIRVSVLPRAIIVDGEAAKALEETDHKVWFSEFNDRRLLRRVELPQEVRGYTAKATLKDGVLRITVRKAAQVTDKAQQVAAASA
jgi:HSP20 family protein